MTRSAERRWMPRIEQLTAYVDGELAPAVCKQVEAWLAAHPEALAEIEGHRQIAELLEATVADEPAEEDWDATWERTLQEAASRRTAAWQPERRQSRRGWRWLSRTVPAAAAVLLMAVALARFPPSDRTVSVDAAIPYPVVSSQEVEINSLDPADSKAFVVGELPARDAFEPAGPRDVVVNAVLPDAEGRLPRVWMPRDAQAIPMILAPGTSQPRGSRDPR